MTSNSGDYMETFRSQQYALRKQELHKQKASAQAMHQYRSDADAVIGEHKELSEMRRRERTDKKNAIRDLHKYRAASYVSFNERGAPPPPPPRGGGGGGGGSYSLASGAPSRPHHENKPKKEFTMPGVYHHGSSGNGVDGVGGFHHTLDGETITEGEVFAPTTTNDLIEEGQEGDDDQEIQLDVEFSFGILHDDDNAETKIPDKISHFVEAIGEIVKLFLEGSNDCYYDEKNCPSSVATIVKDESYNARSDAYRYIVTGIIPIFTWVDKDTDTIKRSILVALKSSFADGSFTATAKILEGE